MSHGRQQTLSVYNSWTANLFVLIKTKNSQKFQKQNKTEQNDLHRTTLKSIFNGELIQIGFRRYSFWKKVWEVCNLKIFWKFLNDEKWGPPKCCFFWPEILATRRLSTCGVGNTAAFACFQVVLAGWPVDTVVLSIVVALYSTILWGLEVFYCVGGTICSQ